MEKEWRRRFDKQYQKLLDRQDVERNTEQNGEQNEEQINDECHCKCRCSSGFNRNTYRKEKFHSSENLHSNYNYPKTHINRNQVRHIDIPSGARITYSEMKRQTSKLYKKLPEVVAKKKEIETDKDKAFIRQRYKKYITEVRTNTLHNYIDYPLHYSFSAFSASGTCSQMPKMVQSRK